LATIQVIEEEGLIENAAHLGQRIMDSTQEMKRKHSTIGDVRGKGLIVGLELVKDRETKEPASDLRDEVVDRAFRKGLLILACGPSGIRLVPALNVDANTVDEALFVLEGALSEAEAAG
jgi:4-aminobutyrate aminotransferase